MQREKLEMQRACQLMKEEMQSTHQLQMEMQRVCQLEKEEMQREKLEMQRACQLMKEEMQSTHQLQMDMQRIRQREEEERLEGSSGMSQKEKGIGCGSSAVPGLPRPAQGTHGCTATEDRTEFLSLRAKGYPLTWRPEMSRSDPTIARAEDRGSLRTPEARTEVGRTCGYACRLQQPQQRRAHKKKRGHPGEDG
jgi:hypothetical protein